MIQDRYTELFNLYGEKNGPTLRLQDTSNVTNFKSSRLYIDRSFFSFLFSFLDSLYMLFTIDITVKKAKRS